MLNTANAITLTRIAMIPIFMSVLLSQTAYSGYIALGIFIIASLTDSVDGYVARKYNQVSNFGKFIDPLADKLLITSAILIFVQWGRISAVAATIIITREFVVTSLRVVAMAEKRDVAAMLSGKIKMVVQSLGVCLLMSGFDGQIVFWDVSLGDLAVWLMVAVTVWSGLEYVIVNRGVFVIED